MQTPGRDDQNLMSSFESGKIVNVKPPPKQINLPSLNIIPPSEAQRPQRWQTTRMAEAGGSKGKNQKKD
jgi:hypothetical protein